MHSIARPHVTSLRVCASRNRWIAISRPSEYELLATLWVPDCSAHLFFDSSGRSGEEEEITCGHGRTRTNADDDNDNVGVSGFGFRIWASHPAGSPSVHCRRAFFHALSVRRSYQAGPRASAREEWLLSLPLSLSLSAPSAPWTTYYAGVACASRATFEVARTDERIIGCCPQGKAGNN